MVKMVISGDVIASTSLTDVERDLIEKSLNGLLITLKKGYKVYGRIIKGDYLECVVDNPSDALRIALIIKSFVKSLRVEKHSEKESNNRLKLYRTYRIRLAIGYGELTRFDSEKGIIDGEAIYLSGRRINELSTYKGERIVIKHTLFFVSQFEDLNYKFNVLFNLLDVILAKSTSKQSEVLYLKLLGLNEEHIAVRMNISQQSVNQHSRSVGWIAIENAVDYFSTQIIKI